MKGNGDLGLDALLGRWPAEDPQKNGGPSWDERADAIVAAVAHKEYQALGVDDLCRKLIKGGAFIDVKAAFDAQALRAAGLKVWRL